MNAILCVLIMTSISMLPRGQVQLYLQSAMETVSVNISTASVAAANHNDASDSCRHFPDTTTSFIDAVREDPEHTSLGMPSDPTIPFPPPLTRSGLLNSAYQGKKVVFVGDSTLYYSIRWMSALMNATHSSSSSSLLFAEEALTSTTEPPPTSCGNHVRNVWDWLFSKSTTNHRFCSRR